MTSSSASLERQTTRVVWRSRLAAFVGPTCALLTAGLLALGTVTLFGRSGFGADLPGPFGPWIAGFLALLAATFGVSRAKKHALTRAQAATWLDVESGATGQLVTAEELGEGASPWRSRTDSRALSVRSAYAVDWLRPVALACLAALFAAGSALVPVRSTAPSGRLEALFEERIGEVREQLAALDEELDLEDDERAAMEDALDRLEADAAAEPDLESTYEAIDRLEEQLAERAEESLEAAQRSLEALAEAAESAASSSESPESMEDAAEALEAAMAALEDFDLESLESANSDFSAADLASLAEQAAAGEFDPADAVELSEEMREALEKALSKLGDAGLLDGSQMTALGELPELTAEQLAMLEAAEQLAAAEP